MDCEMSEAKYRNLMRSLAQAQARYAEDRTEVQRRYEDQCVAAAATAREVKAAATATAAGVRAAAEILDHVDVEAARLWQALRHQAPSRLRRRLGVPPEPAPPHELVEPPPDEPGEDPEPPAVRHLAQAAAVGYAVARGLLLLGDTLHGPPGTVLTAVGQIATFASPLAGLPATKGYADRRGARVDGGAIGLVVLGGMLAVGAH